MTQVGKTSRPLAPGARRTLGALLILAALALVVLVPASEFIEHLHEVKQIFDHHWFKEFGMVLGIAVTMLLFLQFVVSARFTILDKIFSVPRLFLGHRVIAISAAIVASLHPLLMFAPKRNTLESFQVGLWPVLLGVLALTTLWTVALVALKREYLRVPFKLWINMHRLGVSFLVVIISLHAYFVAGEEEPAIMLGIGLLVLIWNKTGKRALLRARPYEVRQVRQACETVHEVTIAPKKGETFAWAPGQFAFVTFKAPGLPEEEHPWTISGTPTRPESLVFSIKCSGDFTSQIGKLSPGDTAIVDGPYGLFSHLALADTSVDLIMVAGGIGITPMLSMLRYLADTNDTRKIRLVWTLKIHPEVVNPEEFEDLKEKLPGLTVRHHFSREGDGHLNAQNLKEHLRGTDPASPVFLCGPEGMMETVKKELRSLGYSKVLMERFSL